MFASSSKTWAWASLPHGKRTNLSRDLSNRCHAPQEPAGRTMPQFERDAPKEQTDPSDKLARLKPCVTLRSPKKGFATPVEVL